MNRNAFKRIEAVHVELRLTAHCLRPYAPGLIGIIYAVHYYPGAKIFIHGYDFTKAKASDCPESKVRASGIQSFPFQLNTSWFSRFPSLKSQIPGTTQDMLKSTEMETMIPVKWEIRLLKLSWKLNNA